MKIIFILEIYQLNPISQNKYSDILPLTLDAHCDNLDMVQCQEYSTCAMHPKSGFNTLQWWKAMCHPDNIQHDIDACKYVCYCKNKGMLLLNYNILK